MSLNLEQRLRVFLAAAPQRVRSIQTLQIGHSQMSKTFHLWREPYAGTTTLETGAVVQMEGANFAVSLAGQPANLDQQFKINLDTTDIEDDFRREMDLIPIDTEERVSIVYREYLSDDLTEPQAVAALQMESVSYQKGAATISAASPRLSITKTGETYSPSEVPMLRGFV